MGTPTSRKATRRGAEKLGAFLSKHGLSCAAAARQLGVSTVAVWEWANGKKVPNGDHRESLGMWTSGAVKPSDWAATDTTAPVKPYRAA